jgi:hypothetical protein
MARARVNAPAARIHSSLKQPLFFQLYNHLAKRLGGGCGNPGPRQSSILFIANPRGPREQNLRLSAWKKPFRNRLFRFRPMHKIPSSNKQPGKN